MNFGTAPKYRFSICACARWEAPYIVEWLTYYRAIGFEHVFLYCNDDDPTLLYARVLPFTQGPAPFVTFRYHPKQGEQSEMYVHFLRDGLEQTEWISFFDIDEYLRLPKGETISQFMSSRFTGDTDCVLFNWIFFGPNGHKLPPAGNVLANFTQREERIHPLTKYVAKASVLQGPKLYDRKDNNGFWHHLRDHVDVPVNAVNVLGEDMRTYYDTFELTSRDFINDQVRQARLIDTAIVHHYAFRSEQAFWERSTRGLKGNFEGQSIWKTLAEGPTFTGHLAGWNAVTDLRLANFWTELLQTAWQTDIADLEMARPISRTGGFQTDPQDDPVWQLDLGGYATIHQVRIRGCNAETAHPLSLSVSIDGHAWVELDQLTMSGVLVVWDGPGAAWARFVRLALPGQAALKFDSVEVFGIR